MFTSGIPAEFLWNTALKFQPFFRGELKKNSMGTFSIDSVTKYKDFYSILKIGNAKYPFPIFNTAKENEPGKHWWIFLDIQPKNNLFFSIR